MKRVLFFLIPIHAFSQEYTVKRPDEAIVPDPYLKVYFDDKNDYKRIESVTTITKNKYNSFRPDTLSITHYNNAGLQFKNIRFDNNKQSSITLLKYDEHNNLLSWQLFENKFSTLALYSYNKNKQLQEIRQLQIKHLNYRTDSNETSRTIFKYDNVKLVEILSSIAGNKIVQKYIYNNKKLIRKTGTIVSKELQYDDNMNLVSIKEYMGSEVAPDKLMEKKTFTYSNTNKLIADSILTSSNLKTNKYQISQYTYNESGTLELMSVKFGRSYRNIEFRYSSNKIKEVNIKTNEGNSAYLKFWIDHRIQDYYSFPIVYQEVFSYDENGNRTSKKVYINKELFSEVEYKINYKK